MGWSPKLFGVSGEKLSNRWRNILIGLLASDRQEPGSVPPKLETASAAPLVGRGPYVATLKDEIVYIFGKGEGAKYSLGNESWTPIDPPPGEFRPEVILLAGNTISPDRVFLFGQPTLDGTVTSPGHAVGFEYLDPGWRTLSRLPAELSNMQAVQYLGKAFFLGRDSDSMLKGFWYQTDTDTWRDAGLKSTLRSTKKPILISTTKEVLYLMQDFDPASNKTVTEGGFLDFKDETMRQIDVPTLPSTEGRAWTGRRLILWSQDGEGLIYEPDIQNKTKGRWGKMPKWPVTSRLASAIVGNNGTVWIWGGGRYRGNGFPESWYNDGLKYVP